MEGIFRHDETRVQFDSMASMDLPMKDGSQREKSPSFGYIFLLQNGSQGGSIGSHGSHGSLGAHHHHHHATGQESTPAKMGTNLRSTTPVNPMPAEHYRVSSGGSGSGAAGGASGANRSLDFAGPGREGDRELGSSYNRRRDQEDRSGRAGLDSWDRDREGSPPHAGERQGREGSRGGAAEPSVPIEPLYPNPQHHHHHEAFISREDHERLIEETTRDLQAALFIAQQAALDAKLALEEAEGRHKAEVERLKRQVASLEARGGASPLPKAPGGLRQKLQGIVIDDEQPTGTGGRLSSGGGHPAMSPGGAGGAAAGSPVPLSPGYPATGRGTPVGASRGPTLRSELDKSVCLIPSTSPLLDYATSPPTAHTLTVGAHELVGHLTTEDCSDVAISFHTPGIIALANVPENSASVWDYHSGRCLVPQLSGQGSDLAAHTNRVVSVAFSNFRDQLLCTGSWDGSLILWDWKDRRAIVTIEVTTGRVYRNVFSLFERDIVIASGSDSAIKLYNVRTLEPVASFKGQALDMRCAASSPFYPGVLSVGGAQGSMDLMIYDYKQGKQLAILRGHTHDIYDTQFSPFYPAIVASVSGDATARVYDFFRAECLAVLKGHTAYVQSVCFSEHHSNLLVTGSIDKTCKIFDWQKQILMANIELVTIIRSVRFSPVDPDTLLVASDADRLGNQPNVIAIRLAGRVTPGVPAAKYGRRLSRDGGLSSSPPGSVVGGEGGGMNSTWPQQAPPRGQDSGGARRIPLSSLD